MSNARTIANIVDSGLTNGASGVAFTPSGTGAVTTTVSAKLKESVSVLDFGAKGDGVTDDTAAINIGISVASTLGVRLYIPGTPNGYLISSTLVLGYGQWIIGDGEQLSVIKSSSAITMIALTSGYGGLKDLKIAGDSSSRTPTIGLALYGLATPCIHNTFETVVIQDTQRGLVLDGYTNAVNPCYWNRFNNVTILKPAIDGVLLTKSGAGDTPNANIFSKVHVYSNAASISGSGFYVQYGNFFNSFTDCESGLSVTTPTACFRVGANAAKTLITNQYCETSGAIVNVQLDAGSVDTSIINLLATSSGSAIYDLSGGAFYSFNAGFPDVSKLGKSMATQVKTGNVKFTLNAVDPTPATSSFFDMIYNNAAPSGSVAVNRGAICWNSNIGISNGPTGWICTVGGTPGTWVPFGDRYLEGTVTFNPGLVANGAQSALSTVTVTGAALGDIVECSFTNDMLGMSLFGYVQAASTVKVGALNLTGAGVTLTSGTAYVRVRAR